MNSLYVTIGQRVDPVRIVKYCNGLDDLTMPQLTHGFDLAQRNVGEFIPSVEKVREWSESLPKREFASTAISLRDMEKSRVKLKVSKEEIDSWLEQGRQRFMQSARDRKAELEAEGTVQSIAHAKVIGVFLDTGKWVPIDRFLPKATSTIPTDPVELDSWRRRKLVENGWREDAR